MAQIGPFKAIEFKEAVSMVGSQLFRRVAFVFMILFYVVVGPIGAFYSYQVFGIHGLHIWDILIYLVNKSFHWIIESWEALDIESSKASV